MPHAKREDYNRYIKDYLKRRYTKRMALGVEMLGGRCRHCGTSDALAFHHVDKSTKSFDIADRIAQYPWKRIVSELSKCILLCKSCHGKTHHPKGTSFGGKKSKTKKPIKQEPKPKVKRGISFENIGTWQAQ